MTTRIRQYRAMRGAGRRSGGLGPLAAFAAGLALGAGLIVSAAPAHLGQGDGPRLAGAAGVPGYVLALDPVGVRTAADKAALTDAPPRPLAAPVRKRLADAAPVVTAAGKAGLADRPSRTAARTQPAIALVIDDLGIVADRSARALRLPEEVTLSFLPYGPVSLTVARAAAARGHEIFLHVPMEPEGDADPGPGALMAGDGGTALRDALARQMRVFAGAVPVSGLNNHMGSRATADRRVMDAVMASAGAWGVAYLDSLTTPRSVARAAAESARVPFIARDVFLDPAAGPDVVLAQLDALEAQARARGVAVAIAHPHETTLDILEVWVRGLARKGLRLVPISEAIRLQEQGAPARMVASAE